MKVTERGFRMVAFKDRAGDVCTIQESSSAIEPRIWFGINDANPQIMASNAKSHGIKTDQTTGWIPYPVPEDVLLSTRMHLSQKDVKGLMPFLKRFLKTGGLFSDIG